jgi:hypothetical protein
MASHGRWCSGRCLQPVGERNALAEKRIQAVSSDSAQDPAVLQPSVLDQNTSTRKHFDYEDIPIFHADVKYCEFENRMMSDDPVSVADDEEIGRASVTNDKEIGVNQARGESVFVDSVQGALEKFNLILPWQQIKEQPKEEKDEIIAEAASQADSEHPDDETQDRAATTRAPETHVRFLVQALHVQTSIQV